MSYGHSSHKYCDACYCNELDEAIAERDEARAELAALREELAERKKYWDAKTAAMENSALRRENEQARALLWVAAPNPAMRREDADQWEIRRRAFLARGEGEP